MRFNWQRFCTENRIPFVTRGPNTARNNISIQCPFCGQADDSQHMGLSLNVEKPFWACWRNKAHRGRNPSILLARLLHISRAQALNMIEGHNNNPDHFEQAVANLAPQEEEEKPGAVEKEIKMPKEFRVFSDTLTWGPEIRFVSYLANPHPKRGFDEYWYKLVKKYDLRWAVTGEYTNRVIIPVYHEGKLATWTARAIGNAQIRYRTLERAQERRDIKECLLLPPDLLNVPRDLLIVSEGPFDAMKLQIFGEHLSATATCLFGLTMSNAQMALLGKLRKRYRQVAVLLDLEEQVQGGTMRDAFHEIFGGNVKQAKLPPGVKDPGDLKPHQVEELIKGLK
jgi:hypothetical protein